MRISTKYAIAIAALASTPVLAQTANVGSAQAVVHDANGRSLGTISFTQTTQGVDIAGQLTGLAAGERAIHIHKNGECAPGPDPETGNIVPFGAAGGHFDPKQSHNHGALQAPAEQAHAGDLPNIVVAKDGRASLRVSSAKLSVAPGEQSVLGRSIVIHEKADDYRTDPSGDSGGRIACGLIEAPANRAFTGRHVLPGANAFPEGIAFDPASGTLFTGSNPEGHIYRVTHGDNKAHVLALGGGPGRGTALGMKLDERKRLWVAGGASGDLALIDSTTGMTLSVVRTPPSPQAFLNDVAISSDGYVYVTDSFRPVIFRIANSAQAPRSIEPWLDLNKTPIRFQPGINLNGIVVTPDGRYLITVQSNTGSLWRIDTRSGEGRQITLDQPLTHGDGLVLRGSSLYVVRNAINEVARVELDSALTSGRVVARVSDPRLKFPTTAVLVGDELLVVNGQLNKMKDGAPVLPFDLVRMRAP